MRSVRHRGLISGESYRKGRLFFVVYNRRLHGSGVCSKPYSILRAVQAILANNSAPLCYVDIGLPGVSQKYRSYIIDGVEHFVLP
jgi:hypothetical protein